MMTEKERRAYNRDVAKLEAMGAELGRLQQAYYEAQKAFDERWNHEMLQKKATSTPPH